MGLPLNKKWQERPIAFPTELIAKEFPLLKEYGSQNTDKDSGLENPKRSYSNFNVDYLLTANDNKIWYLAELKTSDSSEEKEQRERYIKLKDSNVNIYNGFLELLLHIYSKLKQLLGIQRDCFQELALFLHLKQSLNRTNEQS